MARKSADPAGMGLEPKAGSAQKAAMKPDQNIPDHEPQNHELRDAVRLNPEAAEWARLVAAIAERQDRDAFIRLFDHFAPRLNAYLQRQGLDSGAAEEVVQDVMATLWRKAALFDPDRSSLATWLYRVARNRRIDLKRRDRLEFFDPGEPAMDRIDESAGADDAMDLSQREEALRKALENLPEAQLLLVRMAFYEGKTHNQIADETGIALGTVKSRLRLAFTRLRRLLESEGVVDMG
jgi:RNA polymerase sigma factor (sigma-70 family)